LTSPFAACTPRSIDLLGETDLRGVSHSFLEACEGETAEKVRACVRFGRHDAARLRKPCTLRSGLAPGGKAALLPLRPRSLARRHSIRA
jgi:hypothetical protein